MSSTVPRVPSLMSVTATLPVFPAPTWHRILELVSEVMSYLDPPSLASAALVNKQLGAVATAHLYTSVSITDEAALGRFLPGLRAYSLSPLRHTRHLSIPCLPDDWGRLDATFLALLRESRGRQMRIPAASIHSP